MRDIPTASPSAANEKHDAKRCKKRILEKINRTQKKQLRQPLASSHVFSIYECNDNDDDDKQNT